MAIINSSSDELSSNSSTESDNPSIHADRVQGETSAMMVEASPNQDQENRDSRFAISNQNFFSALKSQFTRPITKSTSTSHGPWESATNNISIGNKDVEMQDLNSQSRKKEAPIPESPNPNHLIPEIDNFHSTTTSQVKDLEIEDVNVMDISESESSTYEEAKMETDSSECSTNSDGFKPFIAEDKAFRRHMKEEYREFIEDTKEHSEAMAKLRMESLSKKSKANSKKVNLNNMLTGVESRAIRAYKDGSLQSEKRAVGLKNKSPRHIKRSLLQISKIGVPSPPVSSFTGAKNSRAAIPLETK
ncbi:hypothetical protein AYI69_g10213 [Smittium culicis]|uniref:Uncharacterized protein n=1 Tax=Smittium culicis TaxID=133412 RepID=A0A1R1X7B0_9FUNG|nr:hypothetical protein AYI69_g10213 [Smittium culicis]